MTMADDSLISDFIAESREHLDEIEPDLLTLELQGENVPQDIVNRVFRAIHSIKGGASFLAFESLKTLSHAMESVLMLVRNGSLKASSDIVDPLLSSVDVLRTMIDDIGASDGVPIENEMKSLNDILKAQGDKPVGAAKPKKDESGQAAEQAAEPADGFNADVCIQQVNLDTDELEKCLSDGMKFFCVAVVIEDDVEAKSRKAIDVINELNSVGQCLATSVEMEHIEAEEFSDGGFHALCATVLEADMLAMGADLPFERVHSIPKETIVAKVKNESESDPAAAGDDKSKDNSKSKGTFNVAHTEAIETLRVRVDLLNRLMNMAGELVLGRNQLLRALETSADSIPGLLSVLQNIDRVTTELQEGIMQTRMQAVGMLFNKFPRVVRDLSKQLEKEISLQLEGSEVELDKSIIEMLSDPLTHIVRNCVDHAIELPADREKAGKTRGGTINMLAYHEGGQVNITISDDGRGIDPVKIRKSALEKGVISKEEAGRMSEREIINLVFAPGFSTAEQVTDVSGRGVGMDVVRTNIEKLGGYIEVDSEVGVGTNVMLRLPLTLAIIPSLIVGVGGSRFAVPQVSIKELVWIRAQQVAERIETIRGAPVLRLRGRLLPLVRMSDLMGVDRYYTDPDDGQAKPDRRQNVADRRRRGPLSRATDEKWEKQRSGEDRRQDWHGDYNILVLKAGSNQFGIIVDELFDGEEIVVKPLSIYLKDIKFFAGTTIMGDGRVVMILDASGIADQAGLEFADFALEERRRQEQAQQQAQEITAKQHSIILFSNTPDEQLAVNQDSILRLERLELKDLKTVGDRTFIHYLGRGLPVVRLDDHLPIKPMPEDRQDAYLIIPKTGAQGHKTAAAGIIVANIVDAVDINVDLDETIVNGPGLEGSALVNEKLTLFLDPVKLLQAAGIQGAA